MVNKTNEILSGIRDENNKIIYFVYENFYPQIENLILISKGSSIDAQDVFQDALVVIYNKLKKDDLEIKHSFGTYLYSISKYIWFRELKRRQKEAVYIESFHGMESVDLGIEEEYIQVEKRKLVMDHFFTLKPVCQRLLKLFYDKKSISEITKLMNYSSDQYTKNRKNYCKGELVKQVRENPRFKELMNESFRENSSIPRW